MTRPSKRTMQQEMAYREMEKQGKIKLKAEKKHRLSKEQFVLMFSFERGIVQ